MAIKFDAFVMIPLVTGITLHSRCPPGNFVSTLNTWKLVRARVRFYIPCLEKDENLQDEVKLVRFVLVFAIQAKG